MLKQNVIKHDVKSRFKWFGIILIVSIICTAQYALAQTAQMLDINTLYGSSDGSEPVEFCTIGAVTYFSADDGTYGGHGRELWKTDGTSSGTELVADIYVGSDSSDPQNLTEVNGNLYFSADDGANGRELWVYDGSSLTLVNINTTGDSNPAYFCAFNSEIYFAAEGDTGDGRELWKYNGATGTLAGDIHPTAGSDPTELIVMGSSLYFAANNGVDGRQVCRHETNGTTTMIKNVSGMVGYTTNPDELSAIPKELTVVGNLLYYTAEFFNETVSSGDFLRRELYVTDGTDGGTARISDIGITESLQGYDISWLMDPRDANVRELTVMNGVIYFIAHEPSWIETDFLGPMHGGWTEIWKTDGTLAGTERVTEIGWSEGVSESPNDAGISAEAQNLTIMDNYLYFSATDGNLDASGEHGQELWRTDGTVLGTELIKDINTYLTGNGTQGSPYKNQSSDPKYFCVVNTAFGERLFFQALGCPDGSDSHGREIWMTDGTEAGTVEVKDICPSDNHSDPEDMIALGQKVIFSSETPNFEYGRELYVSDGSEAGTSMLGDIAPGESNSYGHYLTALGATLFLTANDTTHGSELWKSEGTTGTTQIVKDINPSSADVSSTVRAYDLTPLNGELYFFEDDGGRRPNLWKTDGTEAGTVRVHEFLPDGSPDDPQTPTEIGDPSGLTAFDGKLYFSAYDYNLHGLEFWTSNGTDFGTYELKDIYDEPWNPVYGDHASEPANFTVVGATLFFTATTTPYGLDLWQSDGTEAGTVLVKNVDVNPSTLWGSQPFGEFVAFGDQLLWVVETYTYGKELWISDGSIDGTTIVKNIRAGTSDSNPAYLTVCDNKVFFQADDGSTGKELWLSDGTEAGTTLVKDIVSGSGSSNPQNMVEMGNLIYLSVDDGINGAELWVSDGTETGTHLLKDINPGSYDSDPSNLIALPGDLYFFFAATTADSGCELWISDGTEGGTTLMQDINTGTGDSNPANLTLCGPNLYFTASDGTLAGDELWVMNVASYIWFTVSFQTDGTSGSNVNGNTAQFVNYGADCTQVEAVPPVGYDFVKWALNGEDYSTSNPLTISNVTNDLVLTAVFEESTAVNNWSDY